MGYTIAEKILAAHSGGAPVKAGDVVVADVDFATMHDARAGNALKMAAKLGAKGLPFAHQTALVMDHYSPPPPHVEAENTHSVMRVFAKASHATTLRRGDHLTLGIANGQYEEFDCSTRD